MGFFGWLLIIMLSIWVTGRVFGKYILAWGIRKIQQRAMKEMARQANAYGQNYQNPDGKKEQRVNKDMTVEYKDGTATPKEPGWNQIADDVDFEEVRE